MLIIESLLIGLKCPFVGFGHLVNDEFLLTLGKGEIGLDAAVEHRRGLLGNPHSSTNLLHRYYIYTPSLTSLYQYK